MTDPQQHFESHLTVTSAEVSAVDLLATGTGLSKQRIKQAMQKGAVWRTRGSQTQRHRRAKASLKIDDKLHLYYDEQVLSEEPVAAQLIADEGSYSVWYKPYGMRSQGSKWGDHCTINRWVELNLKPQRTAFVVHRLDRAATGLIIIAHEKRTAKALSQLFEQRSIDKCYRVIVHGQFPAAETPKTITEDIEGKAACSHARCVEYSTEKNQSLLEVRIETGRKHQIRKHLAGIGFPVVGDRFHGIAKKAEAEEEIDLRLTAYSLVFRCPVNDVEKHYILPDQLAPHL